MNNLFTIKAQLVRRTICLMLATLLILAGLPVLLPARASAVPTQLANRSIQLSDSGVSAGSIATGIGSGTNVTYRVTFTTAAVATESLIIDFCAEDPILNDTCTAPVAMDASAATLSPVSGQISAANNWTLTPLAGHITLANDGVGADDATAGTQSFDLVGVTNTSTMGTFYARIYTYVGNDPLAAGYTGPTVLGTYQEYGGIAMSTTNTIQITARVQEQLTFCVTKAAVPWTTLDCSAPEIATSPPAVTIGHGATTPILDANTVDTSDGGQPGGGDVFTQLSTNATHGAVINLHSSNTTCGGLSADNGATCGIPASGAGGATAAAIANGATSGTAAFGLFVSNSSIAGGSGGVGTLTPTAPYHDATQTHIVIPTDLWYGMDTTTANNNVISTFGSTVLSTPSPTYRVNNEYVFAATAALTTPAGIYSANLSLIATGTF